MPKGHNINYGVPINTIVSLYGDEVIEPSYANECSAAKITDQTEKDVNGKKSGTVAKKHQISLKLDAPVKEDELLANQVYGDGLGYILTLMLCESVLNNLN
ncbi:MAG: hypothetical protein ACTS73_05445 [Arsenophonus sp. NEOnobi-MAG3]